MKKTKLILAAIFVLLVLLAVALVAVVKGPGKFKPEPPDASRGNMAATADYTEAFTENRDAAEPLLRTSFENVYYTLTRQGDARFYAYAGGALAPVDETEAYEVSCTCSGQTLTATVHILEKDGRTFGCGLFTNKLHPEVLYYDYAFFRVADFFENYRDTNGVRPASAGALLLLLDTDPTRFYSNEKVYSEAFILNADHTAKRFLSNDQRVVGMDGREKADYKMFTDAILDQHTGRNVLFFSSRYYVDYAESGKTDIFTSGGSDSNIDNVRYLTDVHGLYFWQRDGELRFFRSAGDGFSLLVYGGSGEPAAAGGYGGSIADYIVRGEYLLNKATGAVSSVYNGVVGSVTYTCFKSGFQADLFEISPNGKYCVIRGANTGNVAACGLMDLEKGVMRAYTDEVFGRIASMSVQDDGSVILSVAADNEGSSFYQLTANAAA